MYLRTSSRQNKDGTTVRYVSIAHNERRPGGPSVAKVLLPLGEWITHDVAIPGLAEATDDQAYRAMDLLVEADTDAKIQEAVFFAVANLLNLEVDLLFFDTTSTYFERDSEDPALSEAEGGGEAGDAAGFRRYGHSKDSRPDLPQIVIGLAVTREASRCGCGAGRATPTTPP